MKVSTLFIVILYKNRNKKVLNLDLRQSTVKHYLMTFGKLFESLGAIIEKDLSPWEAALVLHVGVRPKSLSIYQTMRPIN